MGSGGGNSYIMGSVGCNSYIMGTSGVSNSYIIVMALVSSISLQWACDLTTS